MVGPLDKNLEDAMGDSFLEKKGEMTLVDLQDTMRDASFMKSTGESFFAIDKSSNNDMPTRSLSLIENDSVSHCPSIEEVIAFGGIPKSTTGVRTSTRLDGQPNADMPQLEKVMKEGAVA
jgi:hypothetical protein